MNFKFTEDQDSIRSVAMRMFEDHSKPEMLRAVEDSGDYFQKALWEDLARSQFLGIALPEDVGGGAMGFVELCILLEMQGRSVSWVPLLPTLVLGALPIDRFGTEAQRKHWLPGVCAGETILTAALAEEDSLEPGAPSTRAACVAGTWHLTGRKICVPAAERAARILVPARSGPEGALGVFLLDPQAPGVTIERQVTTSGEPHGLLILKDARVGHDEVLGDPAHGAEIVEFIRRRATLGLCAMELGIAQRQLELIAEYTTKRHQFGRAIGSFQAVGQRAGDAYIDVQAIRLSTWAAAWRLAEGRETDRDVTLAKYWASEAGHRIAFSAQHLHGGMGYDKDYPLYRYYLKAKEIELSLGNAAWQLARLGTELVDGAVEVME